MTFSLDAQLLGLRPMAERLGLHPRELRTEAERGGIPCVRVGGRGLLFDPKAVVASLQERAQASAPEAKEVRDATP